MLCGFGFVVFWLRSCLGLGGCGLGCFRFRAWLRDEVGKEGKIDLQHRGFGVWGPQDAGFGFRGFTVSGLEGVRHILRV